MPVPVRFTVPEIDQSSKQRTMHHNTCEQCRVYKRDNKQYPDAAATCTSLQSVWSLELFLIDHPSQIEAEMNRHNE